MRMIRIALLTVASIVVCHPVFAQTVAFADNAKNGFVSAGACVGVLFDVPDNALVLGGDARVGIGGPNLEISPRYVYRPLDDGSVNEFDVNLLINHKLLDPGRL